MVPLFLAAFALAWAPLIDPADASDRVARKDAQAQYAAGERYYFGRGVRRNHARAAEAYRRAAEDGLAEAQYRLGRLYEFGQGVRRDKAQAMLWYRRAFQGGSEAVKREVEHGLARLEPVLVSPLPPLSRGGSIIPCAGPSLEELARGQDGESVLGGPPRCGGD
jgi:hypothetical protein